MSESRKLPKVYPFHPAFCFSYFADVEKGKIYENLVMHAMDLKNYYREGKRDIDFLKRNRIIMPVEVKSAKEVEIKKLRNLLWFMEKFNIKKSIVVYAGKEEREIKIKGGFKIKMLPILKLMYSF